MVVWADEEMLHCLLLAAVTGIRPSDVIPLHHVCLAASDLVPQAVKTFPNGPLEVSAIWRSLHCSDLHVWCGVVQSIEGVQHRQVRVWEAESSRGAVEEMKLLLECRHDVSGVCWNM